MLTKEHLEVVKSNGHEAVRALVQSQSDAKSTLFILENLGRLPNNFDVKWVLNLLNSDNQKIRLNAVKTLGKTKQEAGMGILFKIAKTDPSTNVRREAVSALGRMKSKKTVKALSEFLTDEDPKVVSQAIRGLLVFKGDQAVDAMLTSLSQHENETIQAVIKKAYFSSKKTSKDKLEHRKCYVI